MPVAHIVMERVKIPDGVKVEIDEGGNFTVAGPFGTVTRRLSHPRISIRREKDELVFSCEFPKKKEKALVGTLASHLRNMCTGAKDGFQYQMKVVYSHFPIKVTLKGKQLIIENFMGEKKPRVADIIGDAKVLVKGSEITIMGQNIEDVGQSAANIEKTTRIKNRDPRVFQDGIYIVKKG